ncbi:MAG: shikimate kinase, partial [Candidatus Margulisiibacteriota bacterium]
MAGVGKTSIAKAVASQLNFSFIDTDHLSINHFKTDLESLKTKLGSDQFIKVEAEFVVNSLKPKTILAPGGSFVYAKDTLSAIRNNVILVYLFDEPKNIKNRIPNIETRGIIGLEDKSFEELCFERDRLSKNVAHFQFNINHLGFSKTTSQIKSLIKLLN